MTTRDPRTTLILGLVIGLLGSFSDDLLGSSAAVGVLQVVLWIASGVLVVGAFAASRSRRDARPGGLRPTAS